MSPTRTAPCDWELAEYPECAQNVSDAALDTARELLWNLSGRRYGICEVTVRPCREDCGRQPTALPTTGGSWVPVLLSGEWHNIQCGGCGSAQCRCSDVEEVLLPGPVHEVLQVQVDGEVLPPESYRVDNRHRLVRVDGDAWPVCQDLNADLGEEGTWGVTYSWGTPVPEGGRVALGVLACEMDAAINGKPCKLPQRVQTITREGVSMTLLDSFEGLDGGRTGLWMVDSWVDSVMSARAARKRTLTVLSPDTVPRNRVTTWP